MLSLHESTLASESCCEGVESGSSCTSMKSQGVCYIKLMAFIFEECQEAEEDAKADVQTRRTNLHMLRGLSVLCVHVQSIMQLLSLGLKGLEKMAPGSHLVQLRLFDVRSISLKQAQVRLQRADDAWDGGTTNCRSKCQVGGYDMAPQTTMPSCQGTCIM